MTKGSLAQHSYICVNMILFTNARRSPTRQHDFLCLLQRSQLRIQIKMPLASILLLFDRSLVKAKEPNTNIASAPVNY